MNMSLCSKVISSFTNAIIMKFSRPRTNWMYCESCFWQLNSNSVHFNHTSNGHNLYWGNNCGPFQVTCYHRNNIMYLWLGYTGSYMLLKQSWLLENNENNICCVSLFCGIFPLYTIWNNSGINLGGCSSAVLLILQFSYHDIIKL